MARKQGTLNVPNNAEVKAAAPFDARLVVPLKADLLTYQYPYKGMLVSVTDDTTNNGVYQLVGSDASLAASWEKVGSGVPSGGTTGQILSKVSDDDGDATWVDDQGAYLMAEECEYGSHTETREVEVEYYTWDRSPGATDIPVVTNRKLRSTDAKYDPATFASSNADTISFLFQRLYNNKNQSRLLLNSKVVEVDNPNPSLFGAYYFFTFRCGGTTYYVRTSTTDAKSGVFVKNNMFTQEPPFDAINAVDVSAIYSYGTGDYYEVYTRHTRTETREVEVPDYIHNVSCIVKNDLNLDPRTIPSGWGIAAKDVVQIPNNGGEWGEATIDVSKYGFTSADDYSASLLVAGGAGGYGGVNTYIKSKTASSFVIHWARVSGGSATRVDYEYTIIGKGYGNNVSGWGVAKVGTARLTAVQSSGWYEGTFSVTDLGFASGDDYTVQFSIVGGNNDWGKVGDKHVAEKTTSQFIIKGSYHGSETAPTYVDVVYTIIARGYGGSGGSGLPSGGVKGDIIVKQSSADGDVSWTPLDVSEWGVAKSDVVNVPITNQQGSFTISIADLGIASVSDYNVVFSIVGGTGEGAWGDSTVFAHNRTTSAIMGTVNTLQGDIQSVFVSYAIIAKGYGTTVGGGGETPTLDAVLKKGNDTDRSARFTDELNGAQAEIYANGTYMTGNGTEGMRQFSVSQNGIRAVDNLVGTITPKFVVPFEPSGEDQVAMSDAVKASFRNALDTNAKITFDDEYQYLQIIDGNGTDIGFSQDTANTVRIQEYAKDDRGQVQTIFNETLTSKTYVDGAVGDLTTLTTTDKSSAVAAINEVKFGLDNLGEPFRVKNWAGTFNISIPFCTEDIPNGDIPKIVFSIDAVEGADYQIVGMIAYEVFDAASGGNRINCWPVCQFTGNGQKELSVRWMCGGTTRKTAKRINAWVLLKHR